VLWQPCCSAPVDDAFQVAWSWRTHIHPVVLSPERPTGPSFVLHVHRVALVAHRPAFRRFQAGQSWSTAATTPCTAARATLDGGHPAWLITLPWSAAGAASVDGVGTRCAICDAQVSPVRESRNDGCGCVTVSMLPRRNYLRVRDVRAGSGCSVSPANDF